MPTQVKKRLDLAKAFEQELADQLAGRRIFLSGAGFEKADVRAKQKYTMQDGAPVPLDTLAFRAEAKTTARAVYTFQRTDWADLIRAADQAGEIPVFAIRFLKERRDIAIVRQSLVASVSEELLNKIPGNKSSAVVVKSSRIVRPTTYGHCTMWTRAHPPYAPNLLVILPLPLLLAAMHEQPNLAAQ